MPSPFRAGGPRAPETPLPGGRTLAYRRTLLMGIINATPDSFYGGSRCGCAADAVAAAETMLAAGADILDVGGESTRPGAEPVGDEEEARRVVPVVAAIRERFPAAVISADTRKAAVARAALAAGADIVNDVSALSFDEGMAAAVREAGAPVVLMHTRGSPRDMQQKAAYADAPKEVLEYLLERAAFAQAQGIPRNRIILDPGIGFAKLLPHNVELLRRIEEFFEPGYPVLVGASRKTFIGALLGSPESPVPPEKRLEGTLAVTACLAARGVHIVRVHDVAGNAAAIKIAETLWS